MTTPPPTGPMDSFVIKRKASSLSVSVAPNDAVATAPTQVTPTAEQNAGLSPYKARQDAMTRYRETAGDDYVVWQLTDDVLELIPGKLDELQVEEEDDLDNKDAAYESLTQSEVDKYLHLVVVPRAIYELKREWTQDILFADERNDRESGFLMLNTHSSWCMYPVINKLLAAARKEINKATKAVTNSESRPGVASEALKKTLAAVMACDACDHWRLDTESEEDCKQIGKKVTKLFRDLLWFEDDELGLVDPFSRQALISKSKCMSREEWSGIGLVTVATAKNGEGLGRSHCKQPAAKKPKLSPTVTGGASTSALVEYLGSLQDKLKLRVKTNLQLKISSVSNPSQSAVVVVSGATCMKKMNQLCAYVTGHNSVFEYHSQRGTCLKGSRIEICLNQAKMWLADKASLKKAATANAAHAVDKTIKIVQVFSGLTMGVDTGIAFDSPTARTVCTTPGSVVWVSPTDERYEITVQAILPKKCLLSQQELLPRLVCEGDYTPKQKTGFNKSLHQCNRDMQGDRSSKGLWLMGRTSDAEIKQLHAKCASRPLCLENGKGVGLDDKYGFLLSQEKIATAGPPDSAVY